MNHTPGVNLHIALTAEKNNIRPKLTIDTRTSVPSATQRFIKENNFNVNRMNLNGK